MTTTASIIPTTPSWVSLLSRRKLEKVAADDSSDTLRRSVLIHNVMRSTASLPCIETTSSSPPSSHPPPSVFHAPVRYSTSDDDDEFELDDEYDEYDSVVLVNSLASAATAATASYEFPSAASSTTHPSATHPPASMFSFPKLSDRLDQERAWLDALLDDLDTDSGVHVSVVPVTDDSEFDQPGPLYTNDSPSLIEDAPGLLSTQQPLPSTLSEKDSSDDIDPSFVAAGYLSRPSSPTPGPEYFYESSLFEPVPPTSPPGLDANMDSDEDEDDDQDAATLITPETSIIQDTIGYQPDYFLGYPHRNRPHRFNLFY